MVGCLFGFGFLFIFLFEWGWLVGWGKVLSNQPTSEANPTACVEGRIFFKAETGIVLFGWQGRVRSESEVQAAC